jgi:hypothetical protein
VGTSGNLHEILPIVLLNLAAGPLLRKITERWPSWMMLACVIMITFIGVRHATAESLAGLRRHIQKY